jgi:hypothetical protein
VEIHLRAMRAFVTQLEKRRCGATSKRRTKSANASPAEAIHGNQHSGSCADASERGAVAGALTVAGSADLQAGLGSGDSTDVPRSRGDGTNVLLGSAESSHLPRDTLEALDGDDTAELDRDDTTELDRDDTAELAPAAGDDAGGADSPRRRGRYVPRAVRRAVWERDEGRCTYVDDRGVRCRESACLELDHELAHARGGPSTATNVRLRCRTHNQLSAEKDFGREFMELKRATAGALP